LLDEAALAGAARKAMSSSKEQAAVTTAVIAPFNSPIDLLPLGD
jgi:hypothetical protein